MYNIRMVYTSNSLPMKAESSAITRNLPFLLKYTRAYNDNVGKAAVSLLLHISLSLEVIHLSVYTYSTTLWLVVVI